MVLNYTELMHLTFKIYDFKIVHLKIFAFDNKLVLFFLQLIIEV